MNHLSVSDLCTLNYKLQSNILYLLLIGLGILRVRYRIQYKTSFLVYHFCYCKSLSINNVQIFKKASCKLLNVTGE